MSTLATQVALRIPSHILTELTNRDSIVGTSQDSTILEQACTDVTAAFATYSGETFNATVAEHLRLGTVGVLATLRMWSNAVPESPEWNAWIQKVRDYAKTSARDRVVATSNSDLTPTDEVQPGETVAPDFERARFGRVVPRAPGARTSGDEETVR